MTRKILKMSVLVIFANCLFYMAVFGQGESDAVFNSSIRRQREASDNRPLFPARRIFTRINEPTKLGKAMLKPSAEDVAEYKEFLSKSKTGIAKIFSDANCSRFLVDVSDDKCIQAAQMIGQGAYYSFRLKNNLADYWSDLYFADGEFSIVNAPDSLGFFVDLGDIPIEILDKNSSEFVNLQKYQMPKTSTDLKAEKTKIITETEGFTSKVKAKLNTTYGLRMAFWTDRYYGGEDFDVVIILRIVRENEDGSVTFIWRELQRKETSKLIVSKEK